jgi:hypothetical protein
MFDLNFATLSMLFHPGFGIRMTFHSPAAKANPSAPKERDDRIAAREMASYVAAMCGELGVVSRRQGFDTLAYILELAKLEADNLRRANAAPKA